jgi:small subunit ribosomal protein S8
MNDPISNMLTQIRNAQMVKKEAISIPYSDLNFEVARVLKEKGFLKEVDKKGRKNKKKLEIALRYQDGVPAISGIKKVSKSSQRVYKGYQEIRKIKGGYGISVISTSKGVMADEEAKKKKAGGEIICEVW